MADPDFLVMRGIRKSFDGTQALKGVDFSARRGEVHAIVGENGAGKSTLMKILAGALQRDAGEILLDGQPVDAELAVQRAPPGHPRRVSGVQPGAAPEHHREHPDGPDADRPRTLVGGLDSAPISWRTEKLAEIGFTGLDVHVLVSQPERLAPADGGDRQGGRRDAAADLDPR